MYPAFRQARIQEDLDEEEVRIHAGYAFEAEGHWKSHRESLGSTTSTYPAITVSLPPSPRSSNDVVNDVRARVSLRKSWGTPSRSRAVDRACPQSSPTLSTSRPEPGREDHQDADPVPQGQPLAQRGVLVAPMCSCVVLVTSGLPAL